MARSYKNVLKRPVSFGKERRLELVKEVLKDSTPFPKPVTYEDIDKEFVRWADEEIPVSFDGKKVETLSFFSSQRFTEYMQSWKDVDDKKNINPNFKYITRENNPKVGTMNGGMMNIPGERTYLMKRVEAMDEAGRIYYIDYRVKQPFAVDITYTLGLITNKYELLNEVNEAVMDKFKSIDCYIRPNGHFMAMKLADVSDESKYEIDDRRYYSQTYTITVMAYIMREDGFIVEERPKLALKGFADGAASYAEIEETPCVWTEPSPYRYPNVALNIHVDSCSRSYTLKMDMDMKVTESETVNIRSFRLYVNDVIVSDESLTGYVFKRGDEVRVSHVVRYNPAEASDVRFTGYDPSDSVPVA